MRRGVCYKVCHIFSAQSGYIRDTPQNRASLFKYNWDASGIGLGLAVSGSQAGVGSSILLARSQKGPYRIEFWPLLTAVQT